jgi:hypothetical protein
MGLNDKEAWEAIEPILRCMASHGGVLTINWHDRSLAPERLWGDVYAELLTFLRNANVWIDTALRVVKWFKIRRSMKFMEVALSQDGFKLHIEGNDKQDLPDFLVRIYEPTLSSADKEQSVNCKRYKDISFSHMRNEEISLSYH